MKEEEIKTRLIVTETIRQVQKLSELGQREFSRIFYGIKDTTKIGFYDVKSKYRYYQEEGFCYAYNRLGVKNQSRILEYIMGEV